jgi:hypothetical protein
VIVTPEFSQWLDPETLEPVAGVNVTNHEMVLVMLIGVLLFVARVRSPAVVAFVRVFE